MKPVRATHQKMGTNLARVAFIDDISGIMLVHGATKARIENFEHAMQVTARNILLNSAYADVAFSVRDIKTGEELSTQDLQILGFGTRFGTRRAMFSCMAQNFLEEDFTYGA